MSRRNGLVDNENTSPPRRVLKGSPTRGDPVVGGVRAALLVEARGERRVFVAALILARGLRPTGRGTMACITVTALVAARIAGLGIGEATAVFVAKRPELAGRSSQTPSPSCSAAPPFRCDVRVRGADRPRRRSAGRRRAARAHDHRLRDARFRSGDASYVFLLGSGRLRPIALITASASWIYPVLLVALWSTVGLTVLRAAVVWTAAEGIRAPVPPAVDQGWPQSPQPRPARGSGALRDPRLGRQPARFSTSAPTRS